jgi:porphobilinogen deaminase|tara:strand:+ start:958 stop:1179 length:222 start_codon:yes stop_codon:yes gene_type:complete
MAINKKKKPTAKELISTMAAIAVQLEQLKQHVFNGDRALDEYMKMKGDKEAFVKYLEENYKDNDQDNKETKDK